MSAHGTIVTLLELPYESQCTKGRCTPVTLTYQGTVLTIKLFRQVQGRWSAKVAADTGRQFQLYEFVVTVLFHRAGSRRYGKCL
jgi:hypothetical protein